MKTKKTIGILLLVIGIAMYLFSNYITEQVNEGKIKITQSQKAVDQSNSLFSQNPYANIIGKEVVTGPAQQKINEGKQQVSSYEKLAEWLHMGGIVLFVVGGALFILGFMGKKSH